MKRFQKREILHIISLIRKLHNAIAENVKRKKYDVAFELLLECQRSAIDTGTAAEETEGPDAEAVAAFKNYCEEIYRISEALQRAGAEEIPERLNRSLQAVEDQFKKLDCGKLEAVFFPYKASMWDSLESIWEAAEKDEDVEAFVVPIPYFEKNPDGTLGEMHDESGLYPDDVPVYSWEDYKVQERRPDIIFIHNPYDNANRVTSVHPAFYASVLHQYTDMLVYVPYFTVIDDVAENFCVLPGTVFADRVILQSERIRDSYIGHFGKWVSDINGDKNSRQQQLTGWEEKFVALGSPKLDRINRVIRDDVLLPEAWREKIYAKDGSRKKVILYNTGIAALLQNDWALDKIRDTFRIFQASKDAVLWWRPHPLFESTISSMRPQLLQKYREIVEEYIRGNWGIYDDTPDADRAIAGTDAYYGDRSSLVTLYKTTGKPVLIQNILIQGSRGEEAAKEIPIWPSDFYVDGDNIWFMHGKINVLMKYSMAEKETIVVGSVPGEEMFRQELYSNICKYKDRLILIPCLGREIAVYEIPKNQFIKIKLEGVDNDPVNPLFCKAFANGRYLYCIPYYYGKILKLDMESLKYTFVSNWTMPQDFSDTEEEFINDADRIGADKAVAVFGKRNALLLLDMIQENVNIIHFADKNVNYNSVAGIGNKAYIYDSQKKNILIYSLTDRGTLQKVPGDFNDARLESTGTGYLIVDAVYENTFTILNQEGDIEFKEKGSETGKGPLDYDFCYGLCKINPKDNNRFYYFNRYNNTMYDFKLNFPVTSFQFTLTAEDYRKIQKIIIDTNSFTGVENELRRVENLIKSPRYDKVEKYTQRSVPIGKLIFSEMKGLINN